jgi:hypothetical protein
VVSYGPIAPAGACNYPLNWLGRLDDSVPCRQPPPADLVDTVLDP